MKIPKTLIKNEKKYKFIKAYSHIILYEREDGIRECFSRSEILRRTRECIEN